MSQPNWPAEIHDAPPRRRGMGLGMGAAVGALSGLLGPVVLGLIIWAAVALGSGDERDLLVALLVISAAVIPIVLLVVGCVLMIPDQLRGWGVAALVASGVWLISSAGVCTVLLYGALASLETHGMLIPR